MTPELLLEKFVSERSDLRRTTRTRYRMDMAHLGEMLRCPVVNLKPHLIERWAGSDHRRRRCVRVLKSVLNWSVRIGLLDINPIQGVRGPKIRTRTYVPFAGSILGLPAHFRMYRDQVFTQLLIDSGLRVREALALDWESIDLDTGVVQVNCSVDPQGRKQALKVEGSERELVLSRSTVQQLRILRGELSSGPVFRNRWGTRLDLHNWYLRIWQPTIKRAGLKLRIHDLRHLSATLLIEAGLPTAAVQQRLGHQSIQTTIRFYTHRSAKLSQQAASAMDVLFSEKGGGATA